MSFMSQHEDSLSSCTIYMCRIKIEESEDFKHLLQTRYIYKYDRVLLKVELNGINCFHRIYIFLMFVLS